MGNRTQFTTTCCIRSSTTVLVFIGSSPGRVTPSPPPPGFWTITHRVPGGEASLRLAARGVVGFLAHVPSALVNPGRRTEGGFEPRGLWPLRVDSLLQLLSGLTTPTLPLKPLRFCSGFFVSPRVYYSPCFSSAPCCLRQFDKTRTTDNTDMTCGKNECTTEQLL
ncbi:hypothetical protein LZ31DRAFT_66518 [Colletotrichum somersetense]|nr:hypothetical protein LZ31DRAFT_66518 [Colletotrichum somersetense]